MTAVRTNTIPGFNTSKIYQRSFVVFRLISAIVALSFLFFLTDTFAAPPSYRVQFLGAGTPTAINNNNVVVGRILNGSVYSPLVSEAGDSWAVLPIPTGSDNCFPTDINDDGVIVGVSFSPPFNPVGVRWRKIKGVYVVEVLPRLPGQSTSYPTAINNLGQIVGARTTLGYVPTGTGWLYSEPTGVVDLTTFGFWVYPIALNDNGIIIGGQERLNFATGEVDVTGAGPANYNPVGGIAINNAGMMAGTAALRSTSLNIVSLFRYEGASGWRYLTGTTRYTAASSINNLGDIGYGELGAGLYLEGEGLFALGGLLDPATRQDGWTVTGSGALINDSRAVATVVRNSTTNQSGAGLLIPMGDLPAPTAPSGLLGVSHPATRMEPFNSINLVWVNTSSLTLGYELQRRAVDSTEWVTLALTPPGTNPSHTDATVGVNITYEYRVRATGQGGVSAWSPSIFVTSPATPLDTTAPTVAILSPSNNGNVSGIVSVSAQASDDVALEHFEISFWNQFTGQEVIIATAASGGGAIAANWDTRLLTPATYRLRAFAYDTMGNFTNHDISVNIQPSASQNSIRIASISLSATGSVNVTATGRITVRDRSGRPVRGAWVTADWVLPTGETVTVAAITNSTGNAFVSTRSTSGTYTLNIRNVIKPGFTFDSANSQMTKSITR